MHQQLFDTSEILRQQGIKSAVLCPGSRNAPLLISFARNEGIEKYSILDERSAAYMAMGISLSTGAPTVVCCTSGTALLNFAPAVAEAFYQNIPLIAVSADRPPSWIDQQDGQTIRQSGALTNHVKGSFDLPVDLDHTDAQWEYRRKLQDAVALATTEPQGPVHINIPIREPFYPKAGKHLSFSKTVSKRVRVVSSSFLPQEIAISGNPWKSKKAIIVVGQLAPENSIQQALAGVAASKGIPIVADITSNLSGEYIVQHHDLFLDSEQNDMLAPDLVITLGKSLISKSLKLFLRRNKAPHWHIGKQGSADTFQCLAGTIATTEQQGLELLERHLQNDPEFSSSWLNSERQAAKTISEVVKDQPFSDLLAFDKISKWIPEGVNLHLANSMAVRYANMLRPKASKRKIYANRGTSGIDGTNSTAVGVALAEKAQNILLTGDLSLFYDRNAFLHDHQDYHLGIIVFNNGEGGIFDLIKGPESMEAAERKTFLKTTHKRSFKLFAEEFGFTYDVAEDLEGLVNTLQNRPAGKWLLEIKTNTDANKKAFMNLKAAKGKKSP